MSSMPGARARPGQLVKVNCAAIPETLLESELFGHEKGAFTGAVAQRIGRFQMADGGTIFLDEIADMAPQLQAKLLRVAQDGRFQRIGSNTEIHVNARILAATNRNLEEEVKAGRFREDLFYRFNVVELTVPPLARAARGHPAAGQSIAGRVYPGPRPALLLRGRLPGELFLARQRPRTGQRHGARRLAVPGRPHRARTFARPHPARRARPRPPWNPLTRGKLEEMESQAVVQALRKNDFNRTATAKALGISRRALIYKLQRLRDQGQNVDGP